MASLTKRRKQYYSRVTYYDEFGTQKFVAVPLRTTKKADAEVRNKEVESFTATIQQDRADRKSTRLNSSHVVISYAVFCLKKKK